MAWVTALTVRPIGHCGVFRQWLQYQLNAQSSNVMADKHDIMVVASLPSLAIKGLWLFGIMDQVELVSLGVVCRCFQRIPILSCGC